MNFSKYFAVSLILASTAANAMDVAGVTVNGEVSADYSFFDKNQVPANSNGAVDNAYRLNKAQLLFKKDAEQVSFLGRMSYTTDNGVAGNNVASLEQAELYYKVLPNVHIGAGRFLTTLGFESLLKSENAFYNPTIAYQSIVPGYGEGVRVKYVKGEDLTVTLTNMNRVNDAALSDNNKSKATELSATGAIAKVTWFAGYQMGTNNPTAGNKDEKTVTSIWASYKLLDNSVVGVTYDAATSKLENASLNWANSTSVFGTYGMNSHNFGLRWEMLQGASTLREAGNGAGTNYASNKVNSISATDKIALTSNLQAIVELRYDSANDESFANKEGVANKEKSVLGATLGLLAYF